MLSLQSSQSFAAVQHLSYYLTGFRPWPLFAVERFQERSLIGVQVASSFMTAAVRIAKFCLVDQEPHRQCWNMPERLVQAAECFRRSPLHRCGRVKARVPSFFSLET